MNQIMAQHYTMQETVTAYLEHEQRNEMNLLLWNGKGWYNLTGGPTCTQLKSDNPSVHVCAKKSNWI